MVGRSGGTARRAHDQAKKLLHFKGKMARPKSFELLTLRFVVCGVSVRYGRFRTFLRGFIGLLSELDRLAVKAFSCPPAGATLGGKKGGSFPMDAAPAFEGALPRLRAPEPILACKPLDAGELSLIVGHHGEAQRLGVGGDQ